MRFLSIKKIYPKYNSSIRRCIDKDNFQDPFNGYRRYIDIDSFVDFFILNELSNNVDAYRLSTFIHKDISGKLKMGPIWDFNLAFGNANYCNGDAVDKWMFKV